MASEVWAVTDMGDALLLDTVAISEREALHKLARAKSFPPGDLHGIDVNTLRKRLDNPEVRRFKLIEAKRG